jgi:FtsP/CotA-like multicopper oxidase with cupredoxin domain
VLASGLAAAAIGRAAPGTAADDTPATILQLQQRSLEVNGKPASVYGIRQPNGTFGITTKVGERFRVRVENQIGAPSLIHWHGMTPPWQQDGVPEISAPPIPPGGSADYDFPLRFGGTFWMHSHEGFQEQLLMTAPLIIHDDRNQPGEQEIVLMLHDFSFTPPEEIYAALRKPKKMAAMGGMGGGMSGMGGMGGKPSSSMAMPGKPGASAAPDLNDVTYDAFLANERTLADPELVKVEPGGRVLLRVINGSAMSNFHLDLGALSGELIAVDGFRVKPMNARRFPLAVAQRLDIRLAVPRCGGLSGTRHSGGHRAADRHGPRRGRRDGCTHPRYRRAVRARDNLGFGAPPARRRAARAAQGGPCPHDRPHGRHGELRLVDQQCAVDQGRAAAAGRRG